MTVKTRRGNHNQDFDLYEDVEKIKAALIDTASDVKGKAGAMINDSVESVRERSALVKENLEDYTAKKPFHSLGIAFTIGAVLGFLFRK